MDASITRTVSPKVKVSLAPTRASGTVEIMRGSTLLKRVTMTAGVKQTMTLPKQGKGKWTISVLYRDSTAYAPSSKTVYLTVR